MGFLAQINDPIFRNAFWNLMNGIIGSGILALPYWFWRGTIFAIIIMHKVLLPTLSMTKNYFEPFPPCHVQPRLPNLHLRHDFSSNHDSFLRFKRPLMLPKSQPPNPLLRIPIPPPDRQQRQIPNHPNDLAPHSHSYVFLRHGRETAVA